MRITAYAFLGCYAVSVALGLFPLSALDANAFSNYYSHYNALRMAKAVVLGFALAALVLRCAHSGVDVVRELARGTAIGLALLVAVALWERHVTVGVFDWTRDYRITTMFAGMHVGGGAIDAYLAMAGPFALLVVATSRGLLRAAALSVIVGAIYAVIVTYSRGAYIAVAAGLLVMGACAVMHARRGQEGRHALPVATFAVGSMTMLAAAAFGGSYMKDRVEVAQRDSATRIEHWGDSLGFAGHSLVERLFGIGVGRYPEAYLWNHVADSKLPTYRYHHDGGRTYVRLGGGALYMNQAVTIAPFTQYQLSLDLRADSANAGRVDVYVCEKWLLYSRDCQSVSFKPTSNQANWEHRTIKLVSGPLGEGAPWNRAPVRISLANGAPGSEVDVGHVSLTDPQGHELLRNGDFRDGGDYWLFTADDHLPWHAKNIAVHIRVEQGWLGIGCSLILLVLVIRRSLPGLRRGDLHAGALTAALIGALIVGMVDSVVDFPRLTLLMILISAAAVAASTAGARHARPSQSPT